MLSDEGMAQPGDRPVRPVVFDEATIAGRVHALGREITAAFPDGDLLALGLLKGSFIFLSDLVRRIERPLQVDFIVAASYGAETESSGDVRLLYAPEMIMEGRHVLLVEDIIDSGHTVNRIVKMLRGRGMRSLSVCTLLHKHVATALELEPAFVGFDAPATFLVGYGLDHAEDYRNLPYIASLT